MFAGYGPWKQLLELIHTVTFALRKKYPYSELVWSAFSRIRTE